MRERLGGNALNNRRIRTSWLIAQMLICSVACRPDVYENAHTMVGPVGPLRVGETAQLAISVAGSNGLYTVLQPSQIIRPHVIVSSSDPKILTVSDTGLMRGISPGLATVSATPVDIDGRRVTGPRSSGYTTIQVVP